MKQSKQTYYSILDIAVDSTPEEIQSGYLKAKNTYAPDGAALYSLLSERECQEVLDQIEIAYTVLSSPTKRLEYDKVQNIVNQYTKPFLEKNNNFNNSSQDEIIRQKNSQSINKDFSIAQNEAQVSKISAQGRFNLSYSEDTTFEQEIEKREEFTGDFLKRIREYKNVSVERMSDLIKVSKTYIRQIENEEFDKLPAAAYVRGFVYQYAKCLKLNPNIVANSYLDYMKLAQNRNKM